MDQKNASRATYAGYLSHLSYLAQNMDIPSSWIILLFNLKIARFNWLNFKMCRL
jgi:hypothetical protein